MNKINNFRRNYFEITEDPPVELGESRRKSGMKVRLPRNNKFFFIDFFDQCNLRVLTKVNNRDRTEQQPLPVQKYGRNFITNIEDSSPREQKLAKFLEQRKVMANKKRNIRIRVKNQLQLSKQKMRSNSLYTIKQNTLDFYNPPNTIDHNNQKNIVQQQLNIKSERQTSQVLKKLGLLRDH